MFLTGGKQPNNFKETHKEVEAERKKNPGYYISYDTLPAIKKENGTIELDTTGGNFTKL